jgi:hypothetical protein
MIAARNDGMIRDVGQSVTIGKKNLELVKECVYVGSLNTPTNNVSLDVSLHFLKENSILINEQSGFRENHSCESSLNLVLTSWKEDIQNNKIIVGVFLDLKRAFETLERDILLKLMQGEGVNNEEQAWFQDYFTGRLQKTQFGESTSSELPNELGVAQGSCLGPSLFFFYMNRIYEAVGNDCKFNLFADDTLISVAENSLEEAVTKINKTLESLSKWFKQYKLKLNAEKTKYMVITYRKNIQIDTVRVRIDDVELERVTEIKYLGVIIDDKLKFDSNVEYIIKKAAKKVILIGRLSLTTTSKIMLYKSIVAPHFEYCSSILFLANEG